MAIDHRHVGWAVSQRLCHLDSSEATAENHHAWRLFCRARARVCALPHTFPAWFAGEDRAPAAVFELQAKEPKPNMSWKGQIGNHTVERALAPTSTLFPWKHRITTPTNWRRQRFLIKGETHPEPELISVSSSVNKRLPLAYHRHSCVWRLRRDAP